MIWWFRMWLHRRFLIWALRLHPEKHVSIVVAIEDHELNVEDMEARGWKRVLH